jgi:hypothetical protein
MGKFHLFLTISLFTLLLPCMFFVSRELIVPVGSNELLTGAACRVTGLNKITATGETRPDNLSIEDMYQMQEERKMAVGRLLRQTTGGWSELAGRVRTFSSVCGFGFQPAYPA